MRPAQPAPYRPRPVVCVLFTAGLVLTGLAPAAGAREPAARLSAKLPLTAPLGLPGLLGEDAEQLVARFTRLYGSVRAGDAEAREELLQVASALAIDGTRPEAAKLARFYAGLSSEALEIGLQRSERYGALQQEVASAGSSGLYGPSWVEQRERILAELEAIGGAWDPGDDVDGPARALGLAASLRAHAAEQAHGNEARAQAARALDLADRARALFELAGLVRPSFEARLARAGALRVVGRAGEARTAYAHLRLLAIERNDDTNITLALLGLVRLARESGELYTRNRMLNALTGLVDPGENWGVAREHTLRLFHEDYPKAAGEFLQRIDAPTHKGSNVDYRYLQTLCAFSAGDYDEARGRLAGLPSSPSTALLEGWIELQTGSPELAIGAARRALGEELSQHRRADGLILLGTALLAEERSDEALEALDEAVDLAKEQRELVADQKGENVIGEWLGLESIATLARALTERGDDLEAALTCEAFQSGRLRRALGTDAQALDSEGLRAWAARYELGLVTWVIGADTALVVHVSQAGEATAVPIDRGRKGVAQAVRRLREAALNGNGQRLQALGPPIADELLPAALRSELEGLTKDGASAGDHAPRLLLLTHGPLENLPWECLWTGEQWLGEAVATTVLPGLTSAAPGAPPPASWGAPWLLLDASNGGQDLEPLPGAAREIEALAKLHENSRVLRGSETTLTKLRSALSGGASLHAAAHLSSDCGHASADFSPLGLALEDGSVLCTHRIAEWKPALDLAVLSACGSAEGRLDDSVGVQGLARAFLEAGTRNLLVTQWPVDDAYAARAAMFFHAALEDGRTPSEAARVTRQRLREEGAPYADWAAWRLLGRD